MADTDTDVVARIKELGDIVQLIGETVDLKKSGVNYQGLCPFHGEKTPSFSVNPDKQFFHCFGCGESGDIFDFVMKSQGADFSEALRILGGKYGVAIPEKRQSREEKEKRERRKGLFAVTERAAALFESYLYTGPSAGAAHAYLRKRGVSAAIAKRFRLGYAPAPAAGGWNFLGSRLSRSETTAALEVGLLVEKGQGRSYDRFRDRIVFPIFTLAGEVCGFGGRIIGEGQPKYLNSPESPIYNKSSLLLGLYQAKQQLRALDRAIVVEGNFDMVSLVAAGCENVVAPLGTALTREQLRYIKKFTSNVTLLFDGDTAGEKAAVRAVPLFLMEQMAGRVALLPKGHDPDSYVREYGLQKLLKLLEQAKDLPEFVVERLVREHGLGFDGKLKIVSGLKPLLEATGTALQRSLFIAHFAEKLDLPKEELRSLLEEVVPPKPANIGEEPPLPEEPPILEEPPFFEEELYTSPPSQQVQAKPGLDRIQYKSLEFSILNPENFNLLCEVGLREIMAGSLGEAIISAQEILLKKSPLAEPEDLLPCLGPGAERDLVSRILTAPPEISQREELDEVLSILREGQLRSPQDLLRVEMQVAEQAGDWERVRQLMAELRAMNEQIQQERERAGGRSIVD